MVEPDSKLKQAEQSCFLLCFIGTHVEINFFYCYNKNL